MVKKSRPYKLIKFLYKSIFVRQSRQSYNVIIYYSLMVATAICLSLLLEIFTFTRDFFEHSHILIYNTMFTSTIITCSESYNIIMRTSVQMVAATFIGDISAYIGLLLCQHHLWTTIFVYFTFIWLTSGPMLSSKNILPFTIGKRMYLEFFLLIFFIKPSSLGPVIFLKSSLASICTLMFVLVTCLLFNTPFSSDLYVRNCAVIMHRSHQCLKRIGRVLEAKTLLSLTQENQDINQFGDINHAFGITHRLSESFSNLPIFIDEKSQKLIFDRNAFNIKSSVECDYNDYILKKSKESVVDPNLPIYNNNNDYNRNGNKSPSSNSSNSSNSSSNIVDSNSLNSDIINSDNSSDNNSSSRSDNKYKTNSTDYSSDGSSSDKNIEDGDDDLKLKEILRNYKKSFKKSKDNYSLILNKLYQYQNESKGEFWKKKTVSYFKEITVYLEKNFNLILVLHNSIQKEVSRNKFAFLLRIIPHLNELIQLSNNIFIIMENQLYQRYFNFQSWAKKEIPPALEYSQLKILNYFDQLEGVIEKIRIEFQILDASLLGKFHVCGFHFLLSTITQFSRSQKHLSSLIYALSCEIYIHKIFYHPQVIVHIIRYFLNKLKNTGGQEKDKKVKKKQQYPQQLEPKFSVKEKVLFLIQCILFQRILYRWLFTLKFSICLCILVIGYYEALLHSNFILLRNMSWFIVTFIYIMAPTAGGSIFFCFLRFFGTMLGVWLAYTGGVLFSLPSNKVAQSFIYLSWTFLIMFFVYFFCKSKPFHNYINFLTLSYATISFPEFTQGEPLVINSLLRAFHIIIGVALVLAVTMLYPHYDYIGMLYNIF